MKKVLSIWGLSLLLFTGCSDEDMVIDNMPNQLITRSAESMTIENGILVFTNYDSYYNVFKELYQLNPEELVQWDERMGYKSLLTKEFNAKNSVEVIEDSEEEFEKKGELDDIRKTMYSDKGLLIIGDTLYKVIDDYIYQIPNNSEITLSDVESAPENYQNIRFKHTISLKAEPLTSMKSSRTIYADAINQGHDESRTLLTKVAKRRREHVKFQASISVDNQWIMLNLTMTGRAQKKKIGIWGNTFDDEIVWGQGYGNVVLNNGVVRPNIVIPRFENTKKRSNTVPYPLVAAGQLKSCQITAYFDFYKNDTAKDQHYKASFGLTQNDL